MEPMTERVAGLDVHRDTVVATVRIPGEAGGRREETRTFGTMTADLLALRDWLAALGVGQVALESTGVLWKPVYYLLEEDFRVLLVNAAHMKNVPGRKTDVKDSAWIAQLLEHGLLRASFIPPAAIRELRDLTRYRKVLIQERAREAQRLHHVLQDAGIKLSSVASDILGVSGRAMIAALVAGGTDADALAELAKGRLRVKLPLLRQALRGQFRAHHAFMVGEILALLDYLDEALGRLQQRIDQQVAPFAVAVGLLTTIPGIKAKTAEVLVAEIGVDMRQFPTAAHLASWAGLCPGNNESAGKHHSGKTRQGDRWLRTALVEAALAAIKQRDSYLGAHYRRVLRRRGHFKAIVAVAHSLLVIAYHVLATQTPYTDLGGDFFDRQNAEAIQRRCIRQLERLGLQVTVAPKEVAA
jgi:transposase